MKERPIGGEGSRGLADDWRRTSSKRAKLALSSRDAVKAPSDHTAAAG